jgi:GNAT superfamily N-acetyltransferase
MAADSITLREARPGDEPFLREVYACTRAQELAMVPWTTEQRAEFLRFQFDAQDQYYRQKYPDASFQLILENDEPVGRLYILREAEAIRILDITVLPQYRNHGVGGKVIRAIMAEADQNCQSITIWVEQFNASLKMFQLYGFSAIADDGYNYHLARSPQNAAKTQVEADLN